MAQSNGGLARSWNNFTNAFRLAMDSIRAQKLRSFLTLLGVIIGVASVIMVGAAIEGLGVYAEQSTAKAFGSESFLVAQIAATGRLSRRQYFDKVKRNKPIRTDDYRFLEAVNGDTLRTTLFPGDASPLNQIVRIEGIEFTVIGVEERLGSAFGRDQDKSAYIPITAFNRLYGPGNGFALFGRPKPSSGLTLNGALDETRVALRTR